MPLISIKEGLLFRKTANLMSEYSRLPYQVYVKIYLKATGESGTQSKFSNIIPFSLSTAPIGNVEEYFY